MIRATLRQLTGGNEVLADEIAQDTFLRAYRSLKSFRGDAKFSSWLYRIAYNSFQDHVRSQKPQEVFEERQHGSAQSPDTDRVDLQHDLAEAMQELTDKERDAITLCYTSGLTHEEAAATLGWPLGTVKTTILAAKEKLRRKLAPWQDRNLQ